MKRIRLTVLGFALMGMCFAGVRLTARESRVPDVCCSGTGDCTSGKCCDSGAIGLPDCNDLERPGYCRAACIPERR